MRQKRVEVRVLTKAEYGDGNTGAEMPLVTGAGLSDRGQGAFRGRKSCIFKWIHLHRLPDGFADNEGIGGGCFAISLLRIVSLN